MSFNYRQLKILRVLVFNETQNISKDGNFDDVTTSAYLRELDEIRESIQGKINLILDNPEEGWKDKEWNNQNAPMMSCKWLGTLGLFLCAGTVIGLVVRFVLALVEAAQ